MVAGDGGLTEKTWELCEQPAPGLLQMQSEMV